MHLPETAMQIKHPRRILVLGRPDSDISRVVKGKSFDTSEIRSHLTMA